MVPPGTRAPLAHGIPAASREPIGLEPMIGGPINFVPHGLHMLVEVIAHPEHYPPAIPRAPLQGVQGAANGRDTMPRTSRSLLAGRTIRSVEYYTKHIQHWHDAAEER